MSKTPYFCSIGYVMKNEEYSTFAKMMKASELQMYIDKNNYYRNNKTDKRRK